MEGRYFLLFLNPALELAEIKISQIWYLTTCVSADFCHHRQQVDPDPGTEGSGTGCPIFTREGITGGDPEAKEHVNMVEEQAHAKAHLS